MKTLFVLFLILFGFTLQAQKYQDLIIDETNSNIKTIDNQKIISENCGYLNGKTAWNPDLNKVNKDQCDLYEKYMNFSDERLRWIDDVKLSTEMDKKLGMEVEVVTFYNKGQKVEPSGFLESQIKQCKSLGNKEGITTCLKYMGELALETKNMVDAATSLSKSAPKVISETDDTVKKEIDSLKGSKNIGDIKKVKDLKNNAASIADSGKNSQQLLPSLVKTMSKDYSIISGVTKTLKQLEKGL